tara:strand:+ start:9937 stop:10974 length:1038 start_codon:yes stop_codon:yes gene_type:complete
MCYNVIFSFLTSFFITFLAIPKVISFANRYRLSDQAGDRASHEGSVPVFGGIAIFLGIILAISLWSQLIDMLFFVISLIIVFFVGILDDLLGLSPFKKLVGQILATLIIIYFGDIKIDNMHGVLLVNQLSFPISILFTLFVVIVITNGFNLIDGVDGLATGVGVISSFLFGGVALIMNQIDIAIISFALMGALLGFLKYNYHPAKIFMGDTGSLVVGMILSILAINLIQHGLVFNKLNYFDKGPLMAIAFLSIPLFDSLRVFIVRASKGHGPLSAGRDHIHHALLDLGLGHKRTAIILYAISIFLIIFSFFLLNLNLNLNLGIFILSAISYLLLIIPFYILRRKK